MRSSQIVPGIGEIIGGSQREDRLELEKRIVELGMNPDDYKYYLIFVTTALHTLWLWSGFERLVIPPVWITSATLFPTVPLATLIARSQAVWRSGRLVRQSLPPVAKSFLVGFLQVAYSRYAKTG